MGSIEEHFFHLFLSDPMLDRKLLLDVRQPNEVIYAH
jgi:hypothetical protein